MIDNSPSSQTHNLRDTLTYTARYVCLRMMSYRDVAPAHSNRIGSGEMQSQASASHHVLGMYINTQSSPAFLIFHRLDINGWMYIGTLIHKTSLSLVVLPRLSVPVGASFRYVLAPKPKCRISNFFHLFRALAMDHCHQHWYVLIVSWH